MEVFENPSKAEYPRVLDWWVVILMGKAVIFQEIHKGQKGKHHGRSLSRWWFQIFFIFIPTWGDDPI